MRKILKYSGIILAIILIVSVVAVFFAWRSIDNNTILNIIDKKTAPLEKNGIKTKIVKLKIKKQFPSITIDAEGIYVNSKEADVTIKNAHVSLPLLKIVLYKIAGRSYIGKINSDLIDIHLHDKKTDNSSFKFKKITLPIIPIDIESKTINITATGLKVSGKINEKYEALSNSNSISFSGSINKIKVDIYAKTHKNYLSCKVNLDKSNLKYAKLISPELYLNYSFDGFAKVKLKLKSVILQKIHIDKPILNASVDIKKFPIIEIKSLTLNSHNGFKLNLEGKVNSSKPKDSVITAKLSTGYIDINKLNIPESIKDYIFAGEFRVSNLIIDGKPSLNAVKSGKIEIKNARFRIDNKSMPFFVSKADVKITPTLIKATAKGAFDKIKTDSSTFIVYRKEGFPMDMHINLHGEATKAVKTFLQENIFSEEDLKTIGKTDELAGNLKAKIDIFKYRWSPQPHFNFTVNILSEGFSFKNVNIPNRYIKTYGNIIIKRIVHPKTETVAITFNNFKAFTKSSTLKTKQFKLTIDPELGFYGDYNISLSKEDINDFQRRVLNLSDTFAAKKLLLTGTLNGTKNRLNAQMTANIQTEHRQIITNFKAFLDNYKLNVYQLTLKGIGNLVFSGTVDLEKKRLESLEAKAKDLDIGSLKEILQIPENIGGIVSGFLGFNVKNSKIVFKDGSFTVKKGRVGIINKIEAAAILKNGNLILKGATFELLSNKVSANGLFNTQNNLINLKLFSDRFVMDFDKLPSSKEKKTLYRIKIPPYTVNASASVKDLAVKNKDMQIPIGTTKIELLNNPNALKINIFSKKTVAKLNYTKAKGKTTLYIKDKAVWNAITKCNNKHLSMLINGIIFNKKRDIFDLHSVYGNLTFKAKNGCFNNTPSAIAIFSLLNPISSLTKGLVKSEISYSKFYGKLNLKKGIIEAEENNPLILEGHPNVFAYGEYNIFKNRIDAYITFITFSTVNKIVSNIPVVGWIIGGKEKSFTGLSFHVKGDIDDPSIKPIPFKNLAKGALGVVKRTLMIPLKIFGVE